jgi:2-(1,2-epoxy-1,2-dihydrophenyl)acetyl-CoA isomerase
MGEDVAGGPVLARSLGAVTILTLNRPASLNSIDQTMAEGFQAALQAVAEDGACRCLVVTGAGRSFCSGQALPGPGSEEELPADIAGLLRDRYVPIITGLRALMIPVVAAVNGIATGAGLSLALAADLRVASQTAWFSCGFSKLGLVPDAGATYFLPRVLGLPQALRFALTGDRLSADEAHHLGMVARVYPPDRFESQFLEFAQGLASGPTAAFGRTKQALNLSLESSLQVQLELEAGLQQASTLTEDFREGMQAFSERRAPRFRGR